VHWEFKKSDFRQAILSVARLMSNSVTDFSKLNIGRSAVLVQFGQPPGGGERCQFATRQTAFSSVSALKICADADDSMLAQKLSR
jgi:hypothetical protein